MVANKTNNTFSDWLKSVRFRIPGNDGFTLVEILVVLMVLTVGILPLAFIQHNAKRDVTNSGHHTRALNVAHSQMERIKALGFGVAAADSGVVDAVTWNAAVTNISMGLDRIVVTASWQDIGPAQSVVVADLLSLR